MWNRDQLRDICWSDLFSFNDFLGEVAGDDSLCV